MVIVSHLFHLCIPQRSWDVQTTIIQICYHDLRDDIPPFDVRRHWNMLGSWHSNVHRMLQFRVWFWSRRGIWVTAIIEKPPESEFNKCMLRVLPVFRMHVLSWIIIRVAIATLQLIHRDWIEVGRVHFVAYCRFVRCILSSQTFEWNRGKKWMQFDVPSSIFTKSNMLWATQPLNEVDRGWREVRFARDSQRGLVIDYL